MGQQDKTAPKFTPGPWMTLPEEVDRSYVRIRGTQPGSRYKIANVLTPVYEGVHEREAEETRANARLIAATPDLFEALHAARRLVAEDRASLFACHLNPRTGVVDDDLGKIALAEYDAVLAQIDAAIVKAVGSV
ncbi:hypothetical protein NDR89_20095 [Cupriavidus gilardii]|uniref:Uncharacterized protein n=1 Tax=Cupriavidus gilardii TaxID=82541 RepID=A0ABY4VNX2_9BURK|nr:hypothetical protein [Cupriavidus gilardii]USE78940.1 hypothetical protein NDR89_20095 [Cupriavidus gilardii]